MYLHLFFFSFLFFTLFLAFEPQDIIHQSCSVESGVDRGL